MTPPRQLVSQTMRDHVRQMAARLRRQEETIAHQRDRIGTLKSENARLQWKHERDQAEIKQLRSALARERQKDVPSFWEVGSLQSGPVAPTYRERVGR